MKSRIINNKHACVALLCTLVLAYSYICMSKNCFGASMVFIVDEGILTKFETGIITAVFYVVYAVLQIVGGMLTDKLHPERFITVGLLGAAASNLVIYFNQSYPVMLISWTLNACLQFAVWPASFKIVSTLLRNDMQKSSLFTVTFGNPIGVVLGYILAAIVGSEWRMNFLVSAVGLVVIAVLWELVVKSVKPYIEETSLPAPVKRKESSSGSKEFLTVALRSGIVIILILSFTRTMFDLGIKAMAPTMINESYDNVDAVFATVISITILVSGAIGPFISRFIYPKILKNEAVIITLFFLISTPLTVAMLLLGQVHHIVIVILLALVVMLMSAASLFTTSYIAARFNTFGKGATIAGALNCTAALGVVAANTLFTGIADAFGWHGTIMVWIVIMAVSLVISALHIPIWTKFLKSKQQKI